MRKNLLFVTATSLESEALKNIEGITGNDGLFRFGSLNIQTLIAGVGSIATLYNISKWISVNGKPDLAINAGIAGHFGSKLSPGNVVTIKDDCFADLGVENGDDFLTLAEAGLVNADEFP